MQHRSAAPTALPRLAVRRGWRRARRLHSFLRLVSLVALVSITCLGAGSASAASTQIVFDFTTSSSLSLLGGIITTPPDGTIQVGTARLDIEATSSTDFVPGGTAILDQLAVAGTVAKDVGGAANVTGPYSATQVGALAGTLDITLDGASFAQDLMLDLNIVLGCSGAGCATLGFPASDVGISALTLGALPIAGLTTPGAATISISAPIELDGVLGTIDLVGIESSRSFIPEPGTFASLALGLTLLGARHRPQRRR